MDIPFSKLTKPETPMPMPNKSVDLIILSILFIINSTIS